MADDFVFGSTFSGIGAMDLGLERAGMTVAWQCEIEAKPRAVLERHWPDVRRFEDVRDLANLVERTASVGIHDQEHRHTQDGGASDSAIRTEPRTDERDGGNGELTTPRVDLICGGFPCQDVSVAGKRAGLSGKRSGLWFELERVLRAMRPRFVLLENVPGLLSSNAGDDAKLILDTLHDLGYVVDIDIVDSQHFGVPQRRRRVFLVCEQARTIREMRTPTSVLTISQLLSEILLSILAAHSEASSIGPLDWAFPKWSSAAGLNKRMRLFALESESDWLSLLSDWDAASLKYRTGQINISASPSERAGRQTAGVVTSGLWKLIWDERLSGASTSTTSTATTPITDRTIYICALTVLAICERTIPSRVCSHNLLNSMSSILIALKGYIAYARQSAESLFGDLRRVREWGDFRQRAERIIRDVERHSSGRADYPAAVLFEPEGMRGDSQAGGEAGEEVARKAGSGLAKPLLSHKSGTRHNAGDETYIIHGRSNKPREYPGDPHGGGSLGVKQDDKTYALDGGTQSVAAPLRGRSHSPVTNPPGRGGEDDENLVAQPLRANRWGGSDSHGDEGNVVLASTAIDPARDGADNLIAAPKLSQALEATPKGHLHTGQWNTYVASTSANPDGMRAPTGTPGLLDVPVCTCPDGYRYAGCGNAVTAHVAQWIGERMLALEGQS